MKAVLDRVSRYAPNLLIQNLTASTLGVIFFAASVGFPKVDPRNISWLTFKDQRTHWIGWLFFAQDEWRWPPGHNPRYGWGDYTSIVFTDSWPLFSGFFKLINLRIIDNGQFFGIALLISSILLFTGCFHLLLQFRLPFAEAITGTILVGTMPLFWWMQRWYFAISGGMCLIVWSFYAYFSGRRRLDLRLALWVLILLAAIGTNFYLFGIILVIFFAAGLQQMRLSVSSLVRLFLSVLSVFGASAVMMYASGYFSMPSEGLSTGRYGVYTANLLGLFDFNLASRWVPDLDSGQFQYEPTSIGLGTVILLPVILFMAVRKPLVLRKVSANLVKTHGWLVLAILSMFLFSVSNFVYIGSYLYEIRIPVRLATLFSMFRSSVRFIWPLTVIVGVAVVVVISRSSRWSLVLILSATGLQILDVVPQMREVATRPNGRVAPIEYEREFWEQVPRRYDTFVLHTPENIRTGWDECSYAAFRTNRVARCAYLSRAFGLDYQRLRGNFDLFSGRPDESSVYWLTYNFLGADPARLIELYGNDDNAFVRPAPNTVASKEFVYFFPACGKIDNCSFLGSRRVEVRDLFQQLGID